MKKSIMLIKTLWILIMIQTLTISFSIAENGQISLNLKRPNVRNIDPIFPNNEAGISAYINVGKISSSEMNMALQVFRSLIESNSEYSLGIIPMDNNTKIEQNVNVYTYIGFAGWIIAYIPRDEPVSKIIQWNNYPSSVNTIFEKAIKNVCIRINKDFDVYQANMLYYNFEFPEANSMLFIIERAYRKASNSFWIEFPSEYTIYEASFSIFQTYQVSGGSLSVDDVEVANVGSSYNIISDFYDLENTLKPEISHKITITNHADQAYYVYGGNAIIYKK